VLTLSHQEMTVINMQCDDEEIEHHLNSSAKNMQSNRWLFKSQIFCRVHWAFNCGAKELMMLTSTDESMSTEHW
jgi:hypothetical protein